MQRAHHQGHFDFSTFDPDDIDDWRRLRLCLRSTQRDGLRELTRTRHLQHLAGVVSCTGEARQGHWKASLEEMAELVELTSPWLGRPSTDPKDQLREAAQGMWASWDVLFGDHNDPRVQAAIEATARALEQPPARRPVRRRPPRRR